jgi:Zn-finger nucleic acid-binding protein
MVILELDQIEIDHCLKCGGIWLDAGELELLLENAAEVEEVLRQPVAAGAAAGSGRKCPICRKRMEVIEIGDEKKIAIDRCRNGDGLWFDKGELEGVLRILGGDSGNKVVRLLEEMFGVRGEREER